MFVRQYFRIVNGQRQAYWALVESYRAARGPRQRIVAWLGQLDKAGRLGIVQAASANSSTTPRSAERQLPLFEYEDQRAEPRWVQVDTAGVRVENCRQFGGPWLALQLIEQLRLDEFLTKQLPQGRERVPWSLTAMILVIARLLDPSSELHIAEQWYHKTSLPELLGVSADCVDDNRLYRGLDALLPHKNALEVHLKNRLGELFRLEYDLLLYDVTSTYFEGQAKSNPQAQRGYSRDKRSECKQVCIGLVVSRCGMPIGYEVFAGNTADVTTVEEIVGKMEQRYGKSNRIWVMDRGMVSESNLAFLRQGDRRYIVGTPKSMLKKFEQEILQAGWHQIRDGLEVKLCHPPRDEDSGEVDPDQQETFILCRSRERAEKDAQIVRRFEARIEQRLKTMRERCEKQHRDPMKVEREVGRLLGQNTRAARLFDVTVSRTDSGAARLDWKKNKPLQEWQELADGCYLLRTNVRDWSDEELWKAYVQLTEAEAAFRIHKSDLSIRPIWHHKEDRAQAHIFVCFLAYVLWKTLAQLCKAAGLGEEPRRVLDELSELRLVDVVLPTRAGIEIRRQCVTRPSEHQQILLDRLKLRLPTRLIQNQM
jgi:transposase